jgi:hypothetical protein
MSATEAQCTAAASRLPDSLFFDDPSWPLQVLELAL